MVHTRRFAALALLLATTACATTGAGSDSYGRNSTMITAEEVQSAHQANAFDLVRQLRPQWLRTRGVQSMRGSAPIQVYVDNMRMNGLGDLQQVPAGAVVKIEYFDASEATMRWGTDHASGAIKVTTQG